MFYCFGEESFCKTARLCESDGMSTYAGHADQTYKLLGYGSPFAERLRDLECREISHCQFFQKVQSGV